MNSHTNGKALGHTLYSINTTSRPVPELDRTETDPTVQPVLTCRVELRMGEGKIGGIKMEEETE